MISLIRFIVFAVVVCVIAVVAVCWMALGLLYAAGVLALDAVRWTVRSYRRAQVPKAVRPGRSG